MDQVIPVFLATLAAPAGEDAFSIGALFTEADLIVQLVLFGLLGMSVACWTIGFQKYRAVTTAHAESQQFLELFWKSRRLDQVYEQVGRFPDAPVALVFKAGYTELSRLSADGVLDGNDTANIERALRRSTNTELAKLENLTSFLATTGSTAPFIGLFGTVWGILRAFQKIGATGQATIQTVGPDIAHALVATAVGLLAAIPAVMLYNYFVGRIRSLAGEMDAFGADFLNLVKRHARSR
jgi:biopolymer transport protein TolQ